MKSFTIIILAEISRQPSIYSVIWLLIITLMQSEKEKMGQKKYILYSLRKGITGNVMVGPNPLMKEKPV